MAYWGLAVNLLGNSLVGPPPAKDAQKAWEVLDKAKGEAKTERERDWIEALSAYYRDHDKVSVDDRLLAYTKAMEKMTQRYPDDFEAWAYYALTLQASAPKTDKTYANQLKAAGILEKLYKQNPQHPGVSHYPFMLTIIRRSPTKGSPQPAATPASRPPRRMPGTCLRTSTRWSGCGRNRS